MSSNDQLEFNQHQLGACQRPFCEFAGHPEAACTTASHHQFEFVYFRTIFCFSNISGPEYCAEPVLYSKFTDGSQFSGKKTVCKSVAWVTSYSNSRDTGETPCTNTTQL